MKAELSRPLRAMLGHTVIGKVAVSSGARRTARERTQRPAVLLLSTVATYTGDTWLSLRIQALPSPCESYPGAPWLARRTQQPVHRLRLDSTVAWHALRGDIEPPSEP